MGWALDISRNLLDRNMHQFGSMRLTCNLRQNLNAADFQLLEFPLQCCLGFCARPELCSGRSSCLWPKGADRCGHIPPLVVFAM